MTAYEKQLIEEFIKEQEQQALEIERQQKIVNELVNQMVIENKEMKKLDQREED